MKISIFSALLFLALATLNSSCRKENAAQMLAGKKSQKTWSLKSATISPAININGALVTDYFAQLDPCERDDLFIFKTSGKFSYEEGSTKCNSSDPQVQETGTWTLSNNDTILSLRDDSGNSIEYNITLLTSSELIYTTSKRINGVNYTITFTWKS